MDSDGDGVVDAEEIAAGTSPSDSQSVPWRCLASWRFSDGTLTGDDGQQPVVQSNVSVTSSGFAGPAVQLLNTPGVVSLKYRAVELSGRPNISATRGTIYFRFQANWLSGTGPGIWVTLFQTTNFSLRINPNGNILMLNSLSGGTTITNVQIPIQIYEMFGSSGRVTPAATVSEWAYGMMTYSPEQTSLSWDAPSTRVNGTGITPPANPNDPNNFIAIGSAADGTGSINGRMDEIMFFNAPGVLGLTPSLISAAPSNSPPGLNLMWPSASNAVMEVRRRVVGAAAWETTRAAFGTNFFDTTAVAGQRYEYNLNTRIRSVTTGLPDAVGRFLKATRQGTPMHSLGKIILLVDQTLAGSLEPELGTFITNLVGDGWQVLRKDVPRHIDDYSSSISFLTNHFNITNVVAPFVRSNYAVFGPQIKYILSLGHVPVAYTGTIADDGHNFAGGRGAHTGAWASDLYYGDVDGIWTDIKTVISSTFAFNHNYPNDGKFDQDFIPANSSGVAHLEIPVARIDLANMPSFADSETVLLKKYLKKNSDFRRGLRTFAADAMYAEYLAGGTSIPFELASELLSKVAILKQPASGDVFNDTGSYLFGVQSGPGYFDRINDSFTGGFEHTSAQIAAGGTSTNCAFYYLRGSYFPDWNSPDNFMRAILGTTNGGLAAGAFLSASKGWRADGLGVGLTLGHEMYDFANNWSVPGNIQSVRSIQLIGDPTLRYPVLVPPGAVTAVVTNNAVTLTWSASAGATGGYFVYRSNAGALGGFDLLNPVPVSTSSFTDPAAPAGELVYMIRGAASATSGGGTFTNLSQGVFSRPITSADPGTCCLEPQIIPEDAVVDPMEFSIGEAASDTGLTVAATSSNQALIADANIFLGGSGEIRSVEAFPEPDQSGSATITIVAHGDSTLVVKTLQVTVLPVNDRPFFSKGADPSVAQGSGMHIIPNWASGISPGPANEAAQQVSFVLTNDSPHLFSVQPAVSPSGTLTFTVSPPHRGAAQVTVQIQDDGGTANSGHDTSYPQFFSIQVGLPADTDGDGLPDDFEIVHGFNPNVAGEGSQDWDGDGMTTLQELLAGTDPKDSRSSIRIAAAGSLSPTFAVHFKSAPGKTYSFDANDQFPDPLEWQTLATPIPGTGSVIEQLDPSAGGSPRRVYRVVTASGGQELASDYAGLCRLNLLGGSDTLLSLPFMRPAAELAAVTSVSGSSVTVRGTPDWEPNEWVYASGTQSNTYFMLLRSGAQAGEAYTITNNGTATLTVDLEGGSLSGVQAGDSLSIIPYWTLGTVFPGGQGVHTTLSVANRLTEVLFPNLSGSGVNLSAAATYFFFGGFWRRVGGGAVNRNDDVIVPDMYLIVRHNLGIDTVLTTEGTVLPGKLRSAVRRNAGSRQDNFLALPRPLGISLADSGLIASGAFRPSDSVAVRLDELLVFDNTMAGRNKSAAATYFYLNGTWRRVGGGGTDRGGDVVFQPGTGVILRSGSGSENATWTHDAAY